MYKRQAQEVFLCLDNDAAGQAASLRMAEQIAEQFGIASDRLTPKKKDWNDDLCLSLIHIFCPIPAACSGVGTLPTASAQVVPK